MNPGTVGDATMNAWSKRRAAGALAVALFLALPGIVEAQQDDYAITGGTVVTVSGGSIENGTVLVQDGLITAVGSNVTIPAGVERFDASGKFVYPGLIDGGTGLGLQEAGGMAGPVDNFELGPYNPHIEAYIGIDHTSEMLGVQRVGGFTTVVTGLNGRGEPIPGYDSMIDLWGWTPQAMTVEKRIGLRVNWTEDRADDLKAYFHEAKAYAARAEMAEAGELSGFDWDVRMDGMMPAVTGEVPVIFEAREEDAIKSAVEFAEEMGLRYLIRGGRDAWKMTEFLAEHEVKLLFSGIHASPGRDEPYDAHYATPALLHEAGVDFAIYSGGVANVFSLTYEVGMAVAFGLPMEKALRSVTIDAARLLGVDDRLGSIEEGKIANLLITTGNPVDYTSQVETMFVRGERVPWDDKFNRLLRRYRGRLGGMLP
ncbi:MAG: amidohydrolase family protein [Gemmatimonadetes bacterium]|nr:amidohydrolase family protein [Gemmatimonadota bacterium]NNM06598.1 amidohydrolase family protein [Gemmatimonadota bacterium]